MNVNSFDLSNFEHLAYINKQTAHILVNHQKIVQLGQTELHSPELIQMSHVSRELINQVAKTLNDPVNQSIDLSQRKWLEVVLDKINPIVVKGESLEKMALIDTQIKRLQTDIQALKKKPHSPETRAALKSKAEELNILMNTTRNTVIQLDKSQVDSDLMKLCCTRLNIIQEMKDDVAVHRMLLKTEKHEQEAAPILKAADPAKELREKFVQGRHQAVKGYLKLGTEADDVLRGVESAQTTEQNKQTVDVETAFTSLLKDFENTQVEVLNRTEIDSEGKPVDVKIISITTYDNKKIELSPADLSKVNFSKINVTPAQLKKYEKFCTNVDDTTLQYKPLKYGGSGTPTKSDFEETEAQFDMQKDGSQIAYPYKLAINVYSGDAYGPINFFMKGNLDLAASMSKGLDSSQVAKEMLLHSVFCTKALSQLDDYTAPDGKAFLWRGEGTSFAQYGALDQYKQAVDQGGAYIDSAGFLSTAYDKPSSNFFNTRSPAGILIRGGFGKKIIAWSQFEDKEREVLLPPVRLKLESYKEVEVNGKSVVFFSAKLANLDPDRILNVELDISKKAAQSMKAARDTSKVMGQQQNGWFSQMWQAVVS